jgi:hypothetical protein
VEEDLARAAYMPGKRSAECKSACISRQGFQGPGCWLMVSTGVWCSVWCGRTGTGHNAGRGGRVTGYGRGEEV